MSGVGDRLSGRILWGMVAGLVFGILSRVVISFAPEAREPLVWLATEVFDPFGQIFLRLLFFVVVPLVFASLCLGVTQLGRLDRLGPLALRTFALFGLNMAVGVALGLVFMNVVQPGRQISEETRTTLTADYAGDSKRLQERAAQQREQGFDFAAAVDMFMPRNLLQAVVGSSRNTIGDVLPLILFAILVGAAGTTLAAARRQAWQELLETVGQLMTTIVFWALRLAPFAVGCLIASVVLRLGMDYLLALLTFAVGVILVIALHLFGTMTILLRVFTRRSPRQFFGAIRTILVTAFSTSSSSATLPTTIAVTREKLGVSAPTAGFVLPLGATMNMAGSALYEGCVVLFVAQVYGVDLNFMQQLTLLLLAVLSAVAVAGIPGGTLPFIVGLLVTFDLPPEGIALILGVDRILDMSRTALNVGADVVTACIVDRPEQP